MSPRKIKFWFWLANLIPPKLTYFVFISVGAIASTGKYSDTVVPGLTVIEAAERYAHIKKLKL